MYHIDNPEEMSEEERLKEVAAILTMGYLRLKKQFLHPVSNASQIEKAPVLTEKELDCSANKSPHVPEVN